MENTLDFYFWTSMCYCSGKQVSATATIQLNKVDADRFINLFANDDELPGDHVEQAVGHELWGRLRAAMDYAIFRNMILDDFSCIECETEEDYNNNQSGDPSFVPWEELSQDEKIDYILSNTNCDADWEIVAIEKPIF